MAPAVSVPAGDHRRTIALIVVGSAILFAIVQLGVPRLATRLDLTWSYLVGSLAMLACALLLERLVFGRSPGAALMHLGFGRPAPRALLVAGLIAAALLAFFPIVSRITRTPIHLKSDWPWVLAGAIALNGVAEETMFRGWVFGHLRREAGCTFMRAGLISMGIFAAVHLVIFTTAPPAIALGALLVALAASFPTAYLFDRGGNTIWAPVILHVAAHFVRLFDVPEPIAMPTMMAWLVVQIGAGFVVFAFRGVLRSSG